MTTSTIAPPARLTVRRPRIDFSDTPKYWVDGDPQATHAVNILNFGIPAGERWFIDAVRLATAYIQDPTLAADARSFIGQEAVHARLHEKAAEHLGLFEYEGVQAQIDAIDRLRERLYGRVDRLPEPFRRRVTMLWLSGTMLGEHFTGLFADLALDPHKIDRSAIDPAMDALLAWHAAEEMEHRTLPYDIYNHIGGDYLTRVLPLVAVAPLLPFGLLQVANHTMRLDPDLNRGFSVRDYIREVRAKTTPNLIDVVVKLPMYLLPWYHPSHLGDDERARAYLASNPPSLARDAVTAGADD